jgi:predicted peroxiredoxin
MTVYAVERALPGITMEGLAGAQAAAIGAAERSSAEGTKVRYLRSVFLPGDARCLCLFEAPDADAVRRVNDAAGLPYTAVSEAMDLPPPPDNAPPRRGVVAGTVAAVAAAAAALAPGAAPAQPRPGGSGAGAARRFLVHVHTGPEDKTKAALAFLVAATALKNGHAVDLFLAGDGVSLLTAEALGTVEGRGTGRLGAHYEAIVAGGGRFYLSGMSARARGLDEALLAGRPAEFAMPDALVRLAAAADVVMSY